MIELKKMLLGMAEVYGDVFSELRLETYCNMLRDIPIHRLSQAIQEILANPNQRRMPLPAEIRARASGEVSSDQEAVLASNRIVEAMHKFGYPNPTEARRFMGELAWSVVESEGGWESLCERTTADHLPALKAQWRELAKAIQARGKSTGRPPEIPGPAGGIVRRLSDRFSLVRN